MNLIPIQLLQHTFATSRCSAGVSPHSKKGFNSLSAPEFPTATKWIRESSRAQADCVIFKLALRSQYEVYGTQFMRIEFRWRRIHEFHNSQITQFHRIENNKIKYNYSIDVGWQGIGSKPQKKFASKLFDVGAVAYHVPQQLSPFAFFIQPLNGLDQSFIYVRRFFN